MASVSVSSKVCLLKLSQNLAFSLLSAFTGDDPGLFGSFLSFLLVSVLFAGNWSALFYALGENIILLYCLFPTIVIGLLLWSTHRVSLGYPQKGTTRYHPLLYFIGIKAPCNLILVFELPVRHVHQRGGSFTSTKDVSRWKRLQGYVYQNVDLGFCE